MPPGPRPNLRGRPSSHACPCLCVQCHAGPQQPVSVVGRHADWAWLSVQHAKTAGQVEVINSRPCSCAQCHAAPEHPVPLAGCLADEACLPPALAEREGEAQVPTPPLLTSIGRCRALPVQLASLWWAKAQAQAPVQACTGCSYAGHARRAARGGTHQCMPSSSMASSLAFQPQVLHHLAAGTPRLSTRK